MNGTSFEDFAVNNKFIFDNNTFIKKKTGTSKFSFAFSYKKQIYGVWCDYVNGSIFISKDYEKYSHIFATTLENHNPNTLLISTARNYNCWKKLLDNYKMRKCLF